MGAWASVCVGQCEVASGGKWDWGILIWHLNEIVDGAVENISKKQKKSCHGAHPALPDLTSNKTLCKPLRPVTHKGFGKRHGALNKPYETRPLRVL